MTSTSTIVVTTIQEPTECMRTLAQRALSEKMQWIVIGDRKGPSRFELAPAELVSIEEQTDLPFKLARLLPEKHYARKNLGYLLAMSRGCECIYETDDDTAPTAAWHVRTLESEVHRVRRRSSLTSAWANVYEAYSSELIWPRGLPLNQVQQHFADQFEVAPTVTLVPAPIQQGLINVSPDVDAVWRLVLDHEFAFSGSSNLSLPRGVWTPFNSQNTWWWKSAYALMYLPSYCSFRMTDIWRSFVAQRCLWELGYELEYHSADTDQERNVHDLMRDFEQEVVGYLRNDEIRAALESCRLSTGPQHVKGNLFVCYQALVTAGVIDARELDLLAAWLEDCS